MSRAFNCPDCGTEIVVQFLSPGETALCRSCGSRTPVPEDAAEVARAWPFIYTDVTAHLWFLYYLLWFYALFLAIAPVVRRLPEGPKILHRGAGRDLASCRNDAATPGLLLALLDALKDLIRRTVLNNAHSIRRAGQHLVWAE